ncbi:TonB-dependent siderophore receptor [Paracidovorax valerianellae]|uniref:Iron complex outermembrane recepter protein n=1 Tax=Paracidovorax valerianellae TaxID=187868 RepID=A0A1G6XN16_9BURK|nr:TonB-dependent siderophore receptor [Paracidovorax valerianellae]MDA8443496.1 TonB-dependent siderophore receptor [Paracidovorax valerianellae]SDD79133.1 iron complex outermembrane recepter protein [Paracidovorax valerianellae]
MPAHLFSSTRSPLLPFRRTASSTALRAALMALPAAVAAAAALPVQAQSTVPATREYAIAAGPLGTVLSQFAGQAGILLSTNAAVTSGVASPGVRGRWSVGDGLAAVLAGTGLQAVRGPDGIYTLQPAATAQPMSEVRVTGQRTAMLAPVTVTASAAEESSKGPGTGFVAQSATGGTKTGTSLLETPQSVSVVTRGQMEAQGATTLVEGLRYTPGIVAQYGNTDLRYDWFTLRGFTPPARYLDNLRLPFGARGYSQPRIEPWGLERTEVVKGPSSVLYGQAGPGGLINMVSKRPTGEPVREIELQAGSHNRKQAAIDIGGALDQEGVWSYRLVGLRREADTSFDYVSEKKTYLAPSLSFRPSEATQVMLLGQWQSLDSPGGGGAPALPAAGTLDTSRYAALPTRAFVGEPGFDRYQNRQRFIGYEAEHRLNDQTTLRQNLRYGKVTAETRRIQAFCQAACNPAALGRYAWAFPEQADLLTVDTQAQFDFRSGSVAHTVLAGMDFSDEKATYDESNLRVLSTPFNAYQPVYGRDSGVIPSVATHIAQKRRQLGAYVQDQMQWGRWIGVFAGRYDRADTATRTLTTATGRTVATDQDDGKFTGRAALMYTLDGGVVPYLSYSTSFQPAAGTDRLGAVFDPTTGKQIEAGVKYQPAGSKALFTAAVYQLTQQNVLTPDPLSRSFNEQTGEVRVRGLELEARGPVARGLEAVASYAYTDSRVTRANPNAAGASIQGNRFAFVPKQQAALWLDYALQGDDFAGLSLGAGVRHTGATFGDAANVYRVPGVTLIDAAVRWDLGRLQPALKGVRLALNVANLGDKQYVASCLASAGCYYGERRTVYLTARYSW